MVKYKETYLDRSPESIYFDNGRYNTLAELESEVNRMLKSPGEIDVYLVHGDRYGAFVECEYEVRLKVLGGYVVADFYSNDHLITTDYKFLTIRDLNCSDGDDIEEYIWDSLFYIVEKNKEAIRGVLKEMYEAMLQEHKDIQETYDYLLANPN